jgi:7-cyano-7-deazaguanine synthase
MAVPEKHCAEMQSRFLSIPLNIIDLPEGLLTSTMTARSEHRAADTIEPTFVPGRNAIFIAMASARIYHRGDPLVVVGGWNAADAAGYPDCRPSFITAMSFALEQALDCPVHIQAPMLFYMKEDIIKSGLELQVPFEYTWSCYTPRFIEPNKWIACGECVSCKFRAKGFKGANAEDPGLEIQV